MELLTLLVVFTVVAARLLDGWRGRALAVRRCAAILTGADKRRRTENRGFPCLIFMEN